jgi:hypothetical protein
MCSRPCFCSPHHAAYRALIANVVGNFFSGYINSKGALVYTLPAIRAHYLSTAFVLDLIPCVPIYQLVKLYDKDSYDPLEAWLYLPKIVICWRLWAWWRQRQVSY